MIHQNVKDLYYVVLYPCSRLLQPIYRLHYKFFRSRLVKAQVGCGPNYLEGFINIDANFQRKVDYLLDVRSGLPFPDNSLEFIYSCHMMEHLHITEAMSLLKECHRVLKPEGYMRLTLPDFQFVLRILAGDEQSSFPRSFNSRNGQAINFLFCDGQHKYGYTKDLVEELALKLGFRSVVEANGIDKNVPGIEKTEPGGSFSVNIFKAKVPG